MRSIISPVLLILLLTPFFLRAENDTTKTTPGNPPSITRLFNQNQFEYADSTFSINSSLYDFQKYVPKNTLGNTGLPIHDLQYTSFSSSLGFNYYKNHYDYYSFSPYNLNFFNTRTPYTDLFYVMGTKEEQFFKFTFSYNVKKNWNITADFLRIRSGGNYLRQGTNDNCAALSTNYRSGNNRYWLLSAVVYNSFKNTENGGIADDSMFQDFGNNDKKLLDINLNSAKKSVANGTIFLKQILNFGRHSEDTAQKEVIIPGSRLILSSSVDGNYFKYEDENPSAGYYSHIFIDSLKTTDSVFHYKIENELSWKRVDNLRHRGIIDQAGFGLSLRHQYGYVWQQKSDTVFNNLIAGAEVYNTYSRNSFWWRVSGHYVIDGYNRKDYNAEAVIKKQSKDSLNSITLKLESVVKTPDFIYDFYRSNHFVWENNFGKMQKNAAGLSFIMKKIKLAASVTYSVYTDIAYFDNYAMARMYTGTVAVLSAAVKKDFTFYNWHLNNAVIYQQTPDSSVIRLPQFILEHSLYYEHDLLKKALRLQVGASVYYTSAYYANAYMPATGQFYLQDEKKYGNYPFIDFFVNAEIKSVRVFIKVDHLNSGLSGNTYVLTPGYPYAGRTFKFGVSWKFFD
ncbi:MAG: hypothetical protein JWO09_2846 [Bacteroidetes bacterium]|nr:hypothetical protein [Bacteroidota bacterium]